MTCSANSTRLQSALSDNQFSITESIISVSMHLPASKSQVQVLLSFPTHSCNVSYNFLVPEFLLLPSSTLCASKEYFFMPSSINKTIQFLWNINGFPYISLVKQPPFISPVGQYSTCSYFYFLYWSKQIPDPPMIRSTIAWSFPIDFQFHGALMILIHDLIFHFLALFIMKIFFHK